MESAVGDDGQDTGADGLSASVVVVTLNRPSFLQRCLEHLGEQTLTPRETLVVDASADDLSQEVVGRFPNVGYLRNPAGGGHLGLSRNLGLREVTGDVVAFVDDDAYAHPDWLARILEPYGDPSVGGVGGRARNGVEGEEGHGWEDIGRLHPDGTLSGNFAADPGRNIDVDHLLGANMSFRRTALDGIGGIRDGYPGTCVREDSDPALRLRALGWRLVYTPVAVVDHVAAPYPKGKRFDARYQYFGDRNSVVLLARTLGFASPELRRYYGVSLRNASLQFARVGRALSHPGVDGYGRALRTVAGGLSRGGAGLAGAAVGTAAAVRQVRLDREGAPHLRGSGPPASRPR